MRILLAAKHPPGGRLKFGGVQSWISTVARRLTHAMHDVTIWGPEFPLPREPFHLGVFANRAWTKRAIPLCKNRLIVSHGIIQDENPGRLNSWPTFFGQKGPEMALKVAYTSEEVKDVWGAPGQIIRQPIDLSVWRPGNGRDRTLVFYSYRARSSFGLDTLAEELGLNFIWLSNVDEQTARDHLQRAALACASGRAALEAMACDTPTIIADWRDYHETPLVSLNLDQARFCNYSGRDGVTPNLLNMSEVAIETLATQRPREYVEKWHCHEKVTTELFDECLQL